MDQYYYSLFNFDSKCYFFFVKYNITHTYKQFLIKFKIVRLIRIVTCRSIARERLGKQARNKYTTNKRMDPFLGNARNTRTQQ
jgi:hypothetical protein